MPSGIRFTRFKDSTALANAAAELVLSQLRRASRLLFCPAAGSSPIETYKILANRAAENHTLFNRVHLVMLDEWLGLPDSHPSTFLFQIQSQLIEPLKITHSQLFHSDRDPLPQAKEMSRFLDVEGPLDLTLLGLGRNGHLGLNEPGEHMVPSTHVALLKPETLEHPMIQDVLEKPTHGITLGMKEILESTNILLLVSGENKRAVLKKLRHQEVTPTFPASFLWLHRGVECFYDAAADS